MNDTEEKKIKRAAANVNERRRMQNINCGFEALRAILNVENSSKLSKSAILRHAVEMVRNLMSENQQLHDQNQFMRNIYNNNYTSQTMSPPLQTPTSTRNFKRSESSEESPRKRLRMGKPETVNTSLTENSQTTPTVRFNLPEATESPAKSPQSPRKYSTNINKLLASPKRVTRSSVIQQNLAYTSPLQPPPSPLRLQLTPNSQILESPSRRSLRLLEKDHQLHQSPSQHLETPPATRFTDSNVFSHQSYFYPSPSAKSKLNFEDYQHMILTPESMKMMPPRSAKRSLDAIIHAIDQIEKT